MLGSFISVFLHGIVLEWESELDTKKKKWICNTMSNNIDIQGTVEFKKERCSMMFMMSELRFLSHKRLLITGFMRVSVSDSIQSSIIHIKVSYQSNSSFVKWAQAKMGCYLINLRLAMDCKSYKRCFVYETNIVSYVRDKIFTRFIFGGLKNITDAIKIYRATVSNFNEFSSDLKKVKMICTSKS